jgi:hypothetical protein
MSRSYQELFGSLTSLVVLGSNLWIYVTMET